MANGKGNLYISKGVEPIYLAHHLTAYFEQVIKPLSQVVGGEFLDEQEYGGLINGFLYLDGINTEQFNQAYKLTVKACQNDSNLAKYKSQLDRIFQSDERFLQ